MRIGIGSDHAGFQLKSHIIKKMNEMGHDVVDMGPESAERVDYPVYAKKVSVAVACGDVERGILVCGSGIGMAMTANKSNGVRAANCVSEFQARYSRLHNDANVLCLGERVVGTAVAESILEIFLAEEFEGGRHADRVAQINH
ncbi:MAG: ribose 5-phosphate isomerase B [Myxococcales bacterium]|nr:ribose 5-phosphate isomerase B [Myxococcales bacterium]|tara:strand:+ start:240 stop:668 length:429 start_codon:yes stop_codon:yes gene_type:complete